MLRLTLPPQSCFYVYRLQAGRGVPNNVLPGWQDIDKLCTECASLIDNHDKIKDLSAVHYNLGKTLQDVENIVALPQQAAEAEDMLKDDTQLSEVLSLNISSIPGVESLCLKAMYISALASPSIRGMLTGNHLLQSSFAHGIPSYESFNPSPSRMLIPC